MRKARVYPDHSGLLAAFKARLQVGHVQAEMIARVRGHITVRLDEFELLTAAWTSLDFDSSCTRNRAGETKAPLVEARYLTAKSVRDGQRDADKA